MEDESLIDPALDALTEHYQEQLVGLALAAAIAVSETPLSLALNVPGNPHVFGDVIVNCLRYPVEPDETPSLDDAVVGVREALEWAEIDVEEYGHILNLHDAAGRWRVDATFHFVIGNDPSDGEEMPVGVSGLDLLETSRIPDEFRETVSERIQSIGAALLEAINGEDDGDPRWHNVQSTMVH